MKRFGLFCLLLLLGTVATAAAAEPLPPEVVEAVKQLGSKSKTDRAAAYEVLSDKGDARLIPALNAYRTGLLENRPNVGLVIYQSKTDVPGVGEAYPLVDAFTGKTANGPDGKPLYAESLGKDMIKAPRAERMGPVADLLGVLQLKDPDLKKRRQAIIDAADRDEAALLPVLKKQLGKNPDSPVKDTLRESIARLELSHGDPAAKAAAARTLGELGSSRGVDNLQAALAEAKKTDDAQLARAAEASLASIGRYQSFLDVLQTTFAGLSLASILILLSLGLAIIFGLMGVINMAHGEFMMVGAFTTYVVSTFFANHWPAWFNWYPLAAIPLAFLVAAVVGLLCERLVIRFLYGRPLETLLATWGIGLILIQTARVIFGDTLSLAPPSYLQGGWEVVRGLTLPLNRVAIIGFCAACVIVVYLVVNRTRFGLLLRATMQNREMAAALGVGTKWVDGLTFAFGAGLAGLAGVAVPMFDKINPNMGQGYIVDSFMVVVVGGVGNLAGVVLAGSGLGFLSKYLEPLIGGTGGAIYGKIAVLGLIVLFLQWRPSGLFPAKGRLADA